MVACKPNRRAVYELETSYVPFELFCVAGNYVLVTFDKSFGRYAGLKHTRLP